MSITYPASLFITPDSNSHDAVTNYLRSMLCKKNGCLACTECQQIASHQSFSIAWFKPENRYTLDDFDELFKKISFTLEENSQFFFVIEQAHLLSAACANALLKIVEEPPHGYHFIFIAHHLQAVLPTIRSRCIITTVHTTDSTRIENIHAKYFTQKTDPQSFLTYVSKTTITESEIIDLIDFLINYYTQELIKNMHTSDTHQSDFLKDFLHVLHKTTQQQIMPGSGKILLKELYLQKDMLKRIHALN